MTPFLDDKCCIGWKDLIVSLLLVVTLALVLFESRETPTAVWTHFEKDEKAPERSLCVDFPGNPEHGLWCLLAPK